MVAAHQLADSGTQRELSRLMSAPVLRAAEADHWRALILGSGAVQWIEQLIRSRLEQAHRCLDSAEIPGAARAALEDMAIVCTERAA